MLSARAIIKRRTKGGTEFPYPSPVDSGRLVKDDLALWYAVCKEAGLDDVRLHVCITHLPTMLPCRECPFPS